MTKRKPLKPKITADEFMRLLSLGFGKEPVSAICEALSLRSNTFYSYKERGVLRQCDADRLRAQFAAKVTDLQTRAAALQAAL